ncbi:MAG: hypothetical protein QOK00_3220, partial [Thermoleophilaceae bacterium]|nr:hypothetical protein [Thermoleophilaceae bacterium]
MTEDTATIERDLAAVDAALASGAAAHEDTFTRELQELALELRADAPEPGPAFAEELAARVDDGFPRDPRSARGRAQAAAERQQAALERLAARAARGPDGLGRRLLKPIAGVGLPLLLIVVVVFAAGGPPGGSGGDSDSSSSAGSSSSAESGGGGAESGGSGAESGGSGAGSTESSGGDSAASAGGSAASRGDSAASGGGGAAGGGAASGGGGAAEGGALQSGSARGTGDTGVAPAQPRPRDGGFVPGQRDRKIERSFSLELDVPLDDMARVADQVTAVTNRHGGFVLDSSVDTGEDGGGGDFSLRIPTERLRPALRDLAEVAPVIRQSQEGRDVTREHVTAKDRLQAARAER